MTSMEGSPSGEIQKLADMISDPGQRRAFADEPEKTATDAGIDVASLPDEVRSTLFGLSYEELGVISRVKESLDQAGVPREDAAKIF